MSEFNEWLKEYKTDHGCLPSRSFAYEAGQQSMQAVIDQLKVQINNMESCYINLKQINNDQSEIILNQVVERNALQKQVNAVSNLLGSVKSSKYMNSCNVKLRDKFSADLEKALRGDSE